MLIMCLTLGPSEHSGSRQLSLPTQRVTRAESAGWKNRAPTALSAEWEGGLPGISQMLPTLRRALFLQGRENKGTAREPQNWIDALFKTKESPWLHGSDLVSAQARLCHSLLPPFSVVSELVLLDSLPGKNHSEASMVLIIKWGPWAMPRVAY